MHTNRVTIDASNNEDSYHESKVGLTVEPQTVEVRLLRKGNERLGLVLDSSNVVVALRDATPAAMSGEIFVGDVVLAVQGHLCSPERRVASYLVWAVARGSSTAELEHERACT